MARTKVLLVFALVCAGMACAASPALGQLGQGVVAGVVTDAHGPVAGAEIQLLGQANNLAHTYSGPDGTFSVEAWPDTYSVGFKPSAGSGDGFTMTVGIVVATNQTTLANGVLASAPTFGSVAGNASYADHGPNAGVGVNITPLLFASGTTQSTSLETDEAGNWDAGQLPAGFYTVSYSTTSAGNYQFLGVEYLRLAPDSHVTLSKELVGQKPPATVVGTVIGPEGWPVDGASIRAGGSTITLAETDASGRFRLPLPGGAYDLTASGGDDADPASASIAVTDGTISHLDFRLPAKPVPPGTAEGVQAQQLAWFNQQRLRWGLPADVLNVPVWSRACAAHNVYQAQNSVMEHLETPGLAGYSEGGNWAGTHAVLASEGGWGPDNNPWNDAPIHLNQMMAPSLSVVGIDVSHGYSCLTTWPGLKRELPAGQVFTYPGDGTNGIPPSEFAAERPFTPNEQLGIPPLAGRHLFVYEGGTGPFGDVTFRSVSLRSPGGPVEVKTMNGGGFLMGGDIVPVKPLEPYTTYTATVSLEPIEGFGAPDLPAVTHTWSFTTGKANPQGHWNEYEPSGGGRQGRVVHRPQLKLRRRGDHMVAIGVYFKPKQTVVLRRQPRGELLGRVKPNARGRFQLALRWGHKPLLIVTARQGKKVVRTWMRATGHDRHAGSKPAPS